jgi:phi13 family phage major tail protein
MSQGVIIGLRNVVYTKLLTDVVGSEATYGPVKPLAGAISGNINPNSTNDTLFADDGPYEIGTTLGGVTLDLNVADLPLEAQADLFGHTMTTEGILMRKSTDVPPWIAVGFKTLKSNGKYRYTWLNKGKFTIPEQQNETKADKIKFSTPTAKGNFVRRECDDEWERHTDEDATGFTQTTADQWFNGPYAPVTAPVA